jgi:hypothetical protein
MEYVCHYIKNTTTTKTKQKEVREKYLNSKSRTGTHMCFSNIIKLNSKRT